MVAFELQGLAPEHLFLTKRNELFDYELSFSLFRGSAMFSLNSKRAKVDFINGRLAADLTTITDVVVRYYNCIQCPVGVLNKISANAQFEFESPAAFAEFFSTKGTRWESDFPSAGIIAYLAHPTWNEQIRVILEHSMLLPAGGFIALSTYHRSPLITAELIGQVVELFTDSAAQCHLLPKPLP